MILAYRMIPGVLGLGATVAYMAPSAPPDLQYEISRDEFAARMMDSHRLVEGTGMGSLTFRNAYWHDGRLVLPVRAAGAHKTLNCKIYAEQIEADVTRAEVDCNGPDVEKSARGAMAVTIMERIASEHVDATMNRREFDYQAVNNSNFATLKGN